VIAGLGTGRLSALDAIGFDIIFNSSGVFNYAQGAIVFFAALNFAGLLQAGLPWYLAGPIALAMLVVLAFVIERAVLRPLIGQSPLTLFMATIGVSFFIQGGVEAIWGGNPHMLKVGLPESALFTIDYAWAESSGVDMIVQESDLLAIGVGLVLVLCLFGFFHLSRIGQALRAVADDHTASMSVGIPLNRMWVIVWSLSGLTAFVAATVWGTKIQIEPTMIGLALKALPVLILGGLTSIPGALVGGCIIGISELMFETYWGQPLFGGATTEWFAFVLALVFLLFRPQGLFGEPIIERV
jgi:branched-chain amino acid transport system permease protein